MKFLIGLNETYAPQRSQILMMNHTPTLDQAYSMIIREESQRMNDGMGIQSRILENAPMEDVTSALILANASNMQPKRNAHLQCDYFRVKGHTRKTCYKLVGYSPCYKFTHMRRGAYDGLAAATHNANVKEELQHWSYESAEHSDWECWTY